MKECVITTILVYDVNLNIKSQNKKKQWDGSIRPSNPEKAIVLQFRECEKSRERKTRSLDIRVKDWC